jgi:hypothetical protein
MDNPLEEELMSINSIYGDDTFILTNPTSRICTLKFPSCASVVLRIEFSTNYPDAPPSILGTESVGNEAVKGAGKRLVDLAREVLARVYRPGEACVYDLVEEVGILLQDQNISFEEEHQDSSHERGQAEEQVLSTNDLGPEPPWTIAPAITEKKSVFLGRVASVISVEQAKSFLNHYLATDKKAARATHNIVAWRIHGPDGTSFQDCDDDGEDAAGGRLLHLMQLMDVWDVMVICTRWYGGVKLGPDRFRIINNAARDALQLGGFAKESVKKSKR